jgi:Xaa-Pro aminopeptidase
MAKGLTPEVPLAEMQHRWERARRLMSEQGFDALLVYGTTLEPKWMRYFTNYVHPFVLGEAFALLTPHSPEPILLIDWDWFVDQAKEMTGLRDIRAFPRPAFDWRLQELSRLFRNLADEHELSGRRIGFTPVVTPAVYEHAVNNSVPGAQLDDATPLLNELLAYKSEYDQEMIRRAVAVGDAGMMAALQACGTGVPEYEVGLAAERAILVSGGEVGAGVTVRSHIHLGLSSTIRCNFRPYDYTRRKMSRGDMFFIDITASYRGYCTDMCRAVVIGSPRPEQQRMHDCVLAAQDEMLRSIRPGVSGSAMHQLGTAVIEEWGYAKEDENAVWLGHGIGFSNSEPPFATPGDPRLFQNNMFAAVEPGLFLPQHGNTAVEDVVWLREDGVDIVTSTPRELHIA